jgi:hypothetical protein
VCYKQELILISIKRGRDWGDHSQVLACFSVNFSAHGLCLQFVFSSSKSNRCPLLGLYFSISCTEFPLCVLFLPPILPCAGSRCSGIDLRDQRLFSPAVVRVGPFFRSSIHTPTKLFVCIFLKAYPRCTCRSTSEFLPLICSFRSLLLAR